MAESSGKTRPGWRNFIAPVVGVMLLLLAVLAPLASRQSNRQTIAVLFPGRVQYVSQQRETMMQHADEIGVTLQFFYADWNASQQQTQIDMTIQSGFPAVALCAVNSEMNLDALDGKSTKLFTFTNCLGQHEEGHHPRAQSHVGRNEVKAGRVLGNMVERIAIDTPIKIGLVEGHPGTSPQQQRHRGFMEVAEEHPEWTIVWTERIPSWSDSALLEQVSQNDVQRVDVIACQWGKAADTLVEKTGKRLPSL